MKNQKKESARIKPLSLVDMSSAFVLFGLGISVSILVFLLELIYKRINDHNFTDDKVVEIRPAHVIKKKVKPVKKRVKFTTKTQGARAITAPADVGSQLHAIRRPATI